MLKNRHLFMAEKKNIGSRLNHHSNIAMENETWDRDNFPYHKVTMIDPHVSRKSIPICQ
jgi:hypothetical protein